MNKYISVKINSENLNKWHTKTNNFVHKDRNDANKNKSGAIDLLFGQSHYVFPYYRKTCVKRPLSKRPKIGFQDQLALNAGQKFCNTFDLHLATICYFWAAVLHRFYCMCMPVVNALARLNQ